MARRFSLIYFYIFFELGGLKLRKRNVKKRNGREHSSPSIIKIAASVASPLNPVCIIISQLGFSLPRRHTIHMSRFTTLSSYSSSQMECASMPLVLLHDIACCSLVMLLIHSHVMLICVAGKS